MKKKTQDDFSRLNEIKLQKAKIILSREHPIRKVCDGIYIVQSQTGIGWYKVQWNGNEWICNCPDFIKHGHIRPCKHILALKLFIEARYITIEGQEPKIKPVTYSQDWSHYNMSQMQEFELFDQFLYQLVSDIEEPKQKSGPGRPNHSLKDLIFCCVMKIYSQQSSRRSQHLFNEALQCQQISNIIHYNAISRTLLKKEITSILHKLVHLSAQPLVSVETDFAIDSSGFRCSSFGRYCEERHDVKQSRNWLKAHICTGVNTNIVTDIIITDEHGADSPQLKKLIRNTAEHFAIGEVSADMAYLSRKNLEIVGQYGGRAYIPFKSNSTAKSRGSKLWKRAYHYFQLNKDEFMEHYHKRSNAESTFAAIKKKFGETIKSKDRTAQINELLCKIIAYNITVLIHEMLETGVTPEFFSIISLTKEVSMNETDTF